MKKIIIGLLVLSLVLVVIPVTAKKPADVGLAGSNNMDMSGGTGGDKMDGWTKNPANNHLYRLTLPMNWLEAEEQAVKWGGHLVTVNDISENKWLVSTFGGSETFWIGYTDKDIEGYWKWISGENLTYTNWFHHACGAWEPTNSPPGEDAAAINYINRWCKCCSGVCCSSETIDGQPVGCIEGCTEEPCKEDGPEYAPGKWNDLPISIALRGIVEIPIRFMITFDDGPISGKTDSILLQLMKLKVNGEPVKAGFFMVGDDPDNPKLEKYYYAPWEQWKYKGSVKKDPAAANRVAKLSHLIGNHTQHHPYFEKKEFYNIDFVKQEILAAEKEIRNALNESPLKIFRPPYMVDKDNPSGEVRKGAAELKYKTIYGELTGDTWLPFPFLVKLNALRILKNWNRPEPCVLIFHDITPVTYNNIGEIIKYLQDQGFVLVHFDPSVL